MATSGGKATIIVNWPLLQTPICSHFFPVNKIIIILVGVSKILFDHGSPDRLAREWTDIGSIVNEKSWDP